MATVSASSGANFSNGSQGTRGLSAGDWIRLQRLRGARTYNTVNLATNKDIINPVAMPQTVYSKAMLISRDVGTSKIRRPASSWTDYRASQTADFVLQSQAATSGTSQTLTVTKLCRACDNTPTSTLTTRLTGCKVCSTTPVHNRIQ
jgi:hypothetical protein